MERLRTVLLSIGVIIGAIVLVLTVYNQKLRTHMFRFLTAPYELVIAVDTGFKMHIVESELWRYYKQNKRFPSEPFVSAFMRGQPNSIAPANTPLLITDYWGNPFLYRRLQYPEGYELVCLGADKIFRTQDDVIFRWQQTQTVQPKGK